MIYLASTSPRRKRLLREHGIRFKVLKPAYHEKPLPRLSPRGLVSTHALEKGMSCLPLVKKGIVLSADTVVYFDKKIIGKPASIRAAVQTLLKLQGRWHEVFTGVAVLSIKNHRIVKKRQFVVQTRIKIKPMKRGEIVRYFKKVNPLDKAGGYAIQSRSASIVASVKGSFSNAVGLPMERCLVFLRQHP